jgi:tetratricopeptide (TPR) repeat protein
MEARSSQTANGTLPSAAQFARRRLILKDSLKFLTLTAVAVLIGGITTFLFRSFELRREELAKSWAKTGQAALRQGRPADAVTALRTSLSYHPDDRENELALAEALAANGRTNEAENYFLNLWQASPGDGPINLQLARLERTRGKDAQKTIEYYRAAVFGTWPGDAPVRRRDTRLELSNYLIELGQVQAARAELLLAASNNPDAPTQLAIGSLLEAANDPKDALMAYRNAAEDHDDREVGQAKAGELCYRMGDYGCANDLLEKALRKTAWTAEQKIYMGKLNSNAARLQELLVNQDVPPAIRTAHLLDDAHIAQDRLKNCMTQASDSTPYAQLQTQWKDLDSAKNRAALRHDEELQDQYRSLIFDTESATAAACGTPTGDDALLLYLRDHPATHFGAQ